MLVKCMEALVCANLGKKGVKEYLKDPNKQRGTLASNISVALEKAAKRVEGLQLGILEVKLEQLGKKNSIFFALTFAASLEFGVSIAEEALQNIIVEALGGALNIIEITCQPIKEIAPGMLLEALDSNIMHATRVFINSLRLPMVDHIHFKIAQVLLELAGGEYKLETLLKQADKMRMTEEVKELLKGIVEGKKTSGGVLVYNCKNDREAENFLELFIIAKHLGSGKRTSMRLDKYKDLTGFADEYELGDFLNMAEGTTVALDTAYIVGKINEVLDCQEYKEQIPVNFYKAYEAHAEKLDLVLIHKPAREGFCDELVEKISEKLPVHRLNAAGMDLAAVKENKDVGTGATKALAQLVGIEEVKKTVHEIVAAARLEKLRQEKGVAKGPKPRLNMVFSGAPGTAKSTVAALMAKILYENGVISNPKVIVCGRSDLCGKYVGHTAPRIDAKFKEARGGVLVIDEAYSLVGEGKDFGGEAINQIVLRMETENVVVIFCGYKDRMKTFLAQNEGLQSRIPYHIDFPDYSLEELKEIMKNMFKERGFELSDDVIDAAGRIIGSSMGTKDFGNARFVRNLVEKAISHQGARLIDKYGEEVPDELLCLIAKEDLGVEAAKVEGQRSGRSKIGFALD